MIVKGSRGLSSSRARTSSPLHYRPKSLIVQKITAVLCVIYGTGFVFGHDQAVSTIYSSAYRLADMAPGEYAAGIKYGVAFIVSGAAALIWPGKWTVGFITMFTTMWSILLLTGWIKYGSQGNPVGWVLWLGIAAMNFSSVWRFGAGDNR